MKRSTFLLTVIFLFFGTSFMATRDSSSFFKAEEWEKAASGVDYQEHFKELESNDNKQSAVGVFSGFTYIYLLGVLVVIIVVIILVLRNKQQKMSKVIPAREFESVISKSEENIHETDLEKLLNQALYMKEYRLALRINFLIIIKALSHKGIITWSKEKTNWDYFRQIKDKELANGFQAITSDFEKFWYGEFSLNESQYKVLEADCREFSNRIDSYA